MSNETIKCPQCDYEIPVTEVLTHQIRESLKSELESDIQRREQSLAKKNEEVAAKEKRVKDSESSIDEKVEKLLSEKTKEIEATAKKKALSDSELELKSLKEELDEKSKKLSDAQKTELELRKKTRELKEKEEALELEIEKKLEKEREIIKQSALKQHQEEHHLKDLEKEKIISDLKKSLDDAKRKAEQGSMQTQGEVLELDLEDTLRNIFRFDEIEPVPKGVAGADVIQTVKDKLLQPCGKILWESKSTKSWSKGWIQKLKDDQIAVGAEMAIILTEAMPPDVENFDTIDNVWVTKKSLAIPLATVLRETLINLTYARNSAEGMTEKMQVLYQYIVGPEFKQKMEAIIDTFTNMNDQLTREKRAMTKIWKEREKQIERVVGNTSGMYGDFKGLIGSALSDIDSLELEPANEVKQIEEGEKNG